MNELARRIDAALPQTQCTRCGYPDCARYAQAIAAGEAAINQCPPGGAEGIERLAAVTGQPVAPLNPANGIEGPLTLAVIDEDWCIGCTLCIKACPADAIVGSNKLMHTVIEPYCTGCELCLPVCPVDCISLAVVSGEDTGWQAWTTDQAEQGRERYRQRTARLAREQIEHDRLLEAKAHMKWADLAAHSRHTDPVTLDKKRAVIEAALTRARAKRGVDFSQIHPIAHPGLAPPFGTIPDMQDRPTRLIKLTALPDGLPSSDHPIPERRLRGNPLRETWNRVDEGLPAGQVFCGVWRCEPGHWRIAMGPTERELFTVLSGHCRVHDALGGFEEVGPGEGLYIPPDFEGEFEVLEPLTKTYMICE